MAGYRDESSQSAPPPRGVGLKAQVVKATANDNLLGFHRVKHIVWLDDKVAYVAEQAVGSLV